MRRLPNFVLGAEDESTRVENSEEAIALAPNAVGETLSPGHQSAIFAIFEDNLLRALAIAFGFQKLTVYR